MHVESSPEAELVRAVSAYPRLTGLWLRGTPVTDAFLDELHRWPGLEYLDVVDTRVTVDGLQRLAARRPALRFHPRGAR